MANSGVEVTTVIVSGGISAVVAAVVTVVVNIVSGPYLEVRKQRALNRLHVQEELGRAVRVALNAVRLMASEYRWHGEGGRVVHFDDEFDVHLDEMQTAYQGVRGHLSGMDGVEPIATVGRGLRDAGTFPATIKSFRDTAIGHPDTSLNQHRQGMTDDLASAQKLLEDARDCLGPPTPVRRYRRYRLKERVDEL